MVLCSRMMNFARFSTPAARTAPALPKTALMSDAMLWGGERIGIEVVAQRVVAPRAVETHFDVVPFASMALHHSTHVGRSRLHLQHESADPCTRNVRSVGEQPLGVGTGDTLRSQLLPDRADDGDTRDRAPQAPLNHMGVGGDRFGAVVLLAEEGEAPRSARCGYGGSCPASAGLRWSGAR